MQGAGNTGRGARWLWLLVAIALLLVGYAAAGPYLTVRAIRSAIQANDASALSDNIDFPALRASLKAQIEDRLVRRAGAGIQSSMLGGLGLSLASGAIDATVETAVTPLGLGALMQGRVLWSRFDGSIAAGDAARMPFQEAAYRYESPSRFTATVRTKAGAPVVVVLTRSGLRWRLTDIRLPR